MTDSRLEIALEQTIPTHLSGQIQSRLAYVDEWVEGARISDLGDRISLRLRRVPDDVQRARLTEKVRRVVAEMSRGHYRPRIEVLEDRLDVAVPHTDDPMDHLLASGEVHEEATGVYTLGPLVSRLIDYFESRFVDLAGSFDARPYRFPTLIAARCLDRVDYFRAFPHSLTFAAHLREDLEVIDEFSRTAAWEEDALSMSPQAISKIQMLLSPAICYHLYFSLADAPLPGGRLIATGVGSCFRYESFNLRSLERMWDFSMREIVFVGPADFVLEQRELGRQRMSQVLDDLGLAYRVESANDPFFIGEFRRQSAFQNAFQLKFEIQARLPFKDGLLAIGSYNYHQDFFGRHLNITLPDGSPAHTGCVAFGLERFAYAFLAQYGLTPATWPRPVREALS